MHIQQSIQGSFLQLTAILGQMSDGEYRMPIPVLSGASLGQHVRHVIECFQELDKGYRTGVVNYDQRKRDLRIETERSFAIDLLLNASFATADKGLLLTEDPGCTVSTTYYRELLYNLHHAVHHMAIIRIGIHVISDIQLPEGFGVAASTVKFRASKHLIHE